ncbi:hypothetical protein Tco_0295348 [Tanacetum coccineum]
MRPNLDLKPRVPHNGYMENSNLNPKNTTYKNTDLPAGKPSFVSIVHGSPKSSTNTSQPAKPRTVSLIDQDPIDIDDATQFLLVKLKEIDSMIDKNEESQDSASNEDQNEVEKVADTFDDNSVDGLEDIIKNLVVDKDEEVVLDKFSKDETRERKVP